VSFVVRAIYAGANMILPANAVRYGTARGEWFLNAVRAGPGAVYSLAH
jgi:hypothetical protein